MSSCKNLTLSGLEPFELKSNINFINVGERTNVTGSRKFLRLIKEGNYTEAVEIAREQVEGGAQIIDVNMDEGMLDGKEAMVKFLNLIQAEPDIAKLPIMIDSSKWDIIVAGLKTVQGKCVVNSISLKEGEDVFIDQAKIIKKFGAATVVMAFDENGQADTYQRRIDICKRSYDILVNQINFNPQDIIFDPNIFPVATGIKDHKTYAVDFFKATKWIRTNLPCVNVSGGGINGQVEAIRLGISRALVELSAENRAALKVDGLIYRNTITLENVFKNIECNTSASDYWDLNGLDEKSTTDIITHLSKKDGVCFSNVYSAKHQTDYLAGKLPKEWKHMGSRYSVFWPHRFL